MNDSKTGFSGIYPMLYAFFDEHEALDPEAIRREVNALARCGVHGLSMLGVGCESNKMNLHERRTLLEWVAADLSGRLPLCVTVAEPSVPGQIDFVKAASAIGAAWVILQPPPVRGVTEAELIRFFGAVADRAELPVGLQIAPEYLGIDMSFAALAELARQHPNISLLKMEITPLDIARLVEETDGAFDIFNGRAGQEMTDSLRSGCVGIIPGGESADVLAKIYDLLSEGTESTEVEADRRYLEIAPLLTFLEGSLDTLLVYGKRIAARRLGLDPDRARPRRPFAPATEYGLSLSHRLSQDLESF